MTDNPDASNARSAAGPQGRPDCAARRAGVGDDGSVQIPADLVDRVRAAVAGGGTRWVGVDGFGASGKTTIAARLAELVDRAVVVHVDDFARPDVQGWERDRFLRQVVYPLRSGVAARYQRWDWATNRGEEWIELEPGSTMIIDGVSSTDTRLRISWDFTLWVSAPFEVRLRRARERDGETMMDTWLNDWIPSENAYFAAQRPDLRADLIISGDCGQR